MITIHESGEGSEKLQVVNCNNGYAYAFNFGEAGATMLNMFFKVMTQPNYAKNLTRWKT